MSLVGQDDLLHLLEEYLFQCLSFFPAHHLTRTYILIGGKFLLLPLHNTANTHMIDHWRVQVFWGASAQEGMGDMQNVQLPY